MARGDATDLFDESIGNVLSVCGAELVGDEVEFCVVVGCLELLGESAWFAEGSDVDFVVVGRGDAVAWGEAEPVGIGGGCGRGGVGAAGHEGTAFWALHAEFCDAWCGAGIFFDEHPDVAGFRAFEVDGGVDGIALAGGFDAALKFGVGG